MKRLSNVKAREIRRLLLELGYQKVSKRGKGAHEQYHHPETGAWTTLSWKQNDVVPTGTVKRAKDVGLTTSQFLKRL